MSPRRRGRRCSALVRHMAEVERGWFRRIMAGEDAPRIWCTQEEPDADFDGAVADPKVVEEAWAAWCAEVAYAERLVAEAADLGVKGRRGDLTSLLRELLMHMIEVCARRNGHADFLRGRIDGRVGR
ncbi:DUF664 domain-containing protein [Micromonospora sp. DPT]|uniref:mycothiol transferase n=1 Tax=Micromonospora sp. DPT TaxID=3142975 RepID=UPI00320A75D6